MTSSCGLPCKVDSILTVPDREHIPNAVKQQVLREAGYRCGIPTCQTVMPIDLHHLTKVSKNGGNEADNLLPLCPNCHRLHHAGFIPDDALKEYKQRLKGFRDFHSPKPEPESVKPPNGIQSPTGFGAAFWQFAPRTCRIGFEDRDRIIVTGYGCFIDKNIMLTARSVVEATFDLLKVRGDRAVVWSDVGLARFERLEESPISDAAIIKVDNFNTSYAEASARKYGVPFDQAFTKPLQTKVAFRYMPYIGDQVAFLHAPDNTSNLRGAGAFQLEMQHVSFRYKVKATRHLISFALSTLSTRLDYAGSPVFDANSSLVGVITEIAHFPPETFPRPVVSGLLKLTPFETEQKK